LSDIFEVMAPTNLGAAYITS